MAPLSPRSKFFAQNIDEYLISTEDILVCGSIEEPKREVTIVPSSFVERVIRYYNKGLGGSYQAIKAIYAKIARVFYLSAIKWNIKIFIASCTECAKYF